jgi:undecaprenyl pyrophosphate phosphatase UppP
MMHLRSFGLFWWNFVVGDDPRVAAGLAVALALTWLLERADVTAWWLLPIAVGLVLAESVRREARSAEERRNP